MISLFPFTEQDVDMAYALERECFSSPWRREDFAVLGELPCARFFTAKDEGGKLLGFAGVYLIAGEAQLMNIAVAPAARRQGVAKALLSHLLALLTKEQAECCFLEVRESNLPAQSLYRRFGFVESGRRRGYYTDPDEDAILMVRQFSSCKA